MDYGLQSKSGSGVDYENGYPLDCSVAIRLPESDMEFVKNFTLSDFQEKILHRQFHLILSVLV